MPPNWMIKPVMVDCVYFSFWIPEKTLLTYSTSYVNMMKKRILELQDVDAKKSIKQQVLDFKNTTPKVCYMKRSQSRVQGLQFM